MMRITLESRFMILGCLWGCLVPACGGVSVPAVPKAPRDARVADQREEPLVATHARPAVLPEIVPEPPSDSAQWLSGHWVWTGSLWSFERGGWIENPERLRLVPSETRYSKQGELLYFPQYWIDARGQASAAPEVVLPAGTPPTPLLPEDATIP